MEILIELLPKRATAQEREENVMQSIENNEWWGVFFGGWSAVTKCWILLFLVLSLFLGTLKLLENYL